MTKTNLLAALALAATTALTGCAVGDASCSTDDCIEAAPEGYAPDADFDITDGDENVTELAGDRELTEIPARIAELHDATLRYIDGENDASDDQMMREFEASYDGFEVEAHEARELTELKAGRPVAAALDAITVEETKWMLLILDIKNDTPLTLEQKDMVAEAEQSQLHRIDRVTAQPVNVIQPQFDPIHL